MLRTTLFLIGFLLNCLCLTAQATVQPWLIQLQHTYSYKLDIESLSQFYDTPRSYIWLEQQQLSNQAHDALDFISSATQHGLSVDNYHYTLLQQLDPIQDAQQFDILLTDGLLKLIHDLSVGRLEANKADPDWFIPQATFDVVAFLHDALLAKHLKTELMSLAPTSSEYLKLSQALSRYQRFVARGGWPIIPPMPSLRLGDSHKNVAIIQTRLAFETSYIPHKTDKYDVEMEQAIRQFQQSHGLKADGILGKDTRKALNVSASERVQQIRIALERRRWMPDNLAPRHLFINLANYQLHAIDNGTETLAMKIIVGNEDRQTPSFTGQMNRIVINPYWNVPRKLAVEDLLPKQQDDFNYFYLHDIRVYSRENGQKIEHDPYLIDWHALDEDNFPYTLRQDPGEHNALGKMKFLFPNDWAIYLHDTNHPSLFQETARSLSSGCIRVEDPIALANFSLADRIEPKTILEMIESKENLGRRISESLSIYAVYFTVWIDDNGVNFFPDVYQRDERMAKNL